VGGGRPYRPRHPSRYPGGRSGARGAGRVGRGATDRRHRREFREGAGGPSRFQVRALHLREGRVGRLCRVDRAGPLGFAGWCGPGISWLARRRGLIQPSWLSASGGPVGASACCSHWSAGLVRKASGWPMSRSSCRGRLPPGVVFSRPRSPAGPRISRRRGLAATAGCLPHFFRNLLRRLRGALPGKGASGWPTFRGLGLAGAPQGCTGPLTAGRYGLAVASWR